MQQPRKVKGNKGVVVDEDLQYVEKERCARGHRVPASVDASLVHASPESSAASIGPRCS